ncbi:hypothetical protein ES708_31158 [subsurface metagenome]
MGLWCDVLPDVDTNGSALFHEGPPEMERHCSSSREQTTWRDGGSEKTQKGRPQVHPHCDDSVSHLDHFVQDGDNMGRRILHRSSWSF